MLVATTAGDILIWNRPSGRLVELPGAAASARAAAWEPQTGLLALAGQDGKVRLLAPPTFNPVEELPADGEIGALAFSRDGRYLAWGNAGGAESGTEKRSTMPRPSFPMAPRSSVWRSAAMRRFWPRRHGT